MKKNRGNLLYLSVRMCILVISFTFLCGFQHSTTTVKIEKPITTVENRVTKQVNNVVKLKRDLISQRYDLDISISKAHYFIEESFYGVGCVLMSDLGDFLIVANSLTTAELDEDFATVKDVFIDVAKDKLLDTITPKQLSTLGSRLDGVVSVLTTAQKIETFLKYDQTNYDVNAFISQHVGTSSTSRRAVMAKFYASIPIVSDMLDDGDIIRLSPNTTEFDFTAAGRQRLRKLQNDLDKLETEIIKRDTVNSIKFNKDSITILKDKSQTLVPIINPSSAINKAVTWSSSNTKVATVDKNGKVTAHYPGSAIITAITKDRGKKAKITVTVPKISVTGVELNKDKIELTKDKSETLVPTISPKDATTKYVTWSSSNTKVATVDKNGKVTAHYPGSATITVTTKDGSKTDTVTVTVPKVSVTGVKLDEPKIELIKGKSEALVPTISPKNADNKAVTWSSSNTKVATVDKNGKVTAHYPGSATITVTTKDGSKTDTATVTVREPVRVKSVKLNLNKTSIKMNKGQTDKLTATISPKNADNKAVTWSSSNEDVVTVDKSGNIKAVQPGSAKITVTTKDGGKKAQVTVTVPNIRVTSVKLNKSNITLAIGQSEKLIESVSPADASNQHVTWKSSDTKVARVDIYGNVKAYGIGSATITVTTKDGSKKYTAKVTVTRKPVNPILITSLNVKKAEIELGVWKSAKIPVTFSPSNATDKRFSWSSSNRKVAIIEDGYIKTVGSGSAVITLTTLDGSNKTAQIKVTAKYPVPVTGVQLNKSKLVLTEGKWEKLVATLKPNNATNRNVTWKSSNTKVATVNKNGEVKAVGPGSAKITVTTSDGAKKAEVDVTVKKPVLIKDLKLDKSNIPMDKGKSEKLKAIISPSNATNQELTWESSNTKVATVQNGNLIAHAPGVTTITVTTKDGSKKKAKATVTVRKPVDVKSVQLNEDKITLSNGKSTKLVATVSPKNATNQFVIWSSSNTNVATVDIYGNVKAVGPGSATITVKTQDGSKTDKVTVTVPIPVESIKLNKDKITLNKKGNIAKLKATISPKNATYRDVTWSSSDTNVATVDTYGYVKAVGPGSATITVKTQDGSKTDKVTVTVLPIPVKSVKLNETLIRMSKGKTAKLTATISPRDATNQDVTWSSSNTKVVIVDKNGNVKAVGRGSAIITVTTKDGSKKKAKATVTVK